MHEDPLVPPEPNHSTGTAANQSTGSEGDNASPQRHSSGSSSTLTGSSRGGATEGEAAVPPLCGVAHTEAESRLLLRLVGSTVDGLLESGAPNVSPRQ